MADVDAAARTGAERDTGGDMIFTRRSVFIAGPIVVAIIAAFLVLSRDPQRAPLPAIASPVQAPRQSGVLIAPAVAPYKKSAPGAQGFKEILDLLVGNSMNFFQFAADWNNLEPAVGQFKFGNDFVDPLTLIVSQYPQIKGFALTVRMIDTGRQSMPDGLQGRPFDDPDVLAGFDGLIDALAAEPLSTKLTYLILGNEIDAFLGTPKAAAAFVTFYKRAVDRIHQRMPGVKVSAIMTAAGATTGATQLFAAVNAYSDFVTYSYYPVEGFEQGKVAAAWKMKAVTAVAADLIRLADLAGNKPFAFSEIGCAASPLNNSSEEKQAAFIQEMFRVLDPYQKQGRIAFLLYHALYDYTPGVCKQYAAVQGISSDTICSFVESIGLRTYETGAPRQGWGAFVDGAKTWNPAAGK